MENRSDNTPKCKSHISPERADELYEQILRIMIVGKKYKEADFSASQLSHILNTNMRYVSLVIASRFHTNYANLVNKLRVSDAMTMLADDRYKDYDMSDIGRAVGFNNRQSFYSAFVKYVGKTPRAYRLENHSK